MAARLRSQGRRSAAAGSRLEKEDFLAAAQTTASGAQQATTGGGSFLHRPGPCHGCGFQRDHELLNGGSADSILA